MGANTQCTKRRIVGSPKPGDPWPSYSPVPSPVRPLSSPTASRDALHVLTIASPFCGLVLKAMWTSGVVEETGKLPEENLNLVSHSRVTSPAAP